MKNETTYGLAPMEGVTDLPFRLWLCLTSKPDFASTPFLRVTANFPPKRIPRDYCPELRELRPYAPYRLVPQLMAATTDDFIRIAETLLPLHEFVDFNCGCPAARVVGHGAGSSILQDPDAFGERVATIATALGPQKLSVKMRTGFHSADEFPGLLRGLLALSLARLNIHGRTRPDRYQGTARWDLINDAAARTPYPVVGSGDIVGAESLMKPNPRYIKTIMVGRGAMRNPWVFSELRSQQPVMISFETLNTSLCVLALLYELAFDREEELMTLVKDGLLATSPLRDADRWRQVYEKISGAYFHNATFDKITTSRVTLGRIKMLWNYLRTSLPTAFVNPLNLRAKSFQDLRLGLAAAHDEYRQNAGWNATFPVIYNSAYDRFFSGQKPAVEETPSLVH